MPRTTATSSTAYSYQRFSSAEQGKGDSLRRQTELRDAWLHRNGIALDTSVTLKDEGVSGFSGKNRDDTKALGTFLSLVQQGRIARGSYLIVESLDRLSREHVQEALRLLLNLTAAGIRIVQLLPVEVVYDGKSDMVPLLMALMELSRGHGESMMKSERVGAAWHQKKKLAAEKGTPVTKRLPAWLKMAGGRIVLDEDKAAIVRRVYDMAIAGYGLGVITKRLNAEKVPMVGHASFWARSYVAKLLTNRAVVGEYQPHSVRTGKRLPEGQPIPGYYPAAIPEGRWHSARAAMVARRQTGGRPSPQVNLFQGRWHDARDGKRMHLVNKGRACIVNYGATMGLPGSTYVGFPLAVFESAVLSCLREIDPEDILPRTDSPADRSLTLAGKLADIDGRMTKIKAQLLDGDDIDGIVEVLRSLEGKRKAVAEELATLRRQAATPLSAAWKEAHTLVDALEAVEDAADARTRLQSALRRTVESIWCLFLNRSTTGVGDKNGRLRVAAVQLWFTGGAHRDYLIIHQLAQRNAAASREQRTLVRSFAESGDGPLDLRKRKDAAKLLRELERMDLSAIVEGSGRSHAKKR